MGAFCCIAARERSIPESSDHRILHRNIHYSPSWGFHWDHQRRVSGEVETFLRNNGLQNKTITHQDSSCTSSEVGSPLENSSISQDSLISEESAGKSITVSSRPLKCDQSISRLASLDAKESSSCSSLAKPSSSLPSTSAFWVSTKPVPEPKLQNYPSLQCGPYPNSDPFGHNDMIKTPGSRKSASSSLCSNFQTCGVCLQILSEYCVIGVLICGHVFHCECLENLTPEMHKYDPRCPICFTNGNLHLRIKSKEVSKKSRNHRVIDSNIIMGDDEEEDDDDELKRSSSCLGRAHLIRQFSFGSKGTRSFLSEHHGNLFTRSAKE